MKIRVLLGLILLTILACTQKLKLHNTSFYGSPVLTSSSKYEMSYEFKADTYIIHVKQFSTDTASTVFESGKYEIRKKEVILTPQVKILCDNKRESKFIDHQISYPCLGIGVNYHNGFYLNRDTIPETHLKNLGFSQHIFQINKFQDRLVLFDGIRGLYER